MGPADGLARMLARPIAHRGLHACGGAGPLENTIAAALAAVEAGFGIECDVQLASDGTPVVFHDDTLERLSERPERLADLDAAALTAIPLLGGSSIPTLAAFLEAIAGRVALVVEIKGGADGIHLAAAVLALVEAYPGPLVVESFDPAIVAACRDAPCPVGLVGPGETPVSPSALPRCDFLSWNVERLGDAPAPWPLTTWTVRTPEQAASAAAAGAQIVFEGYRPDLAPLTAR